MKWSADRDSAIAALESFLPLAGRPYAETRNFDDGPGRSNVSLLSPWLHAGVLSEREVCERVLRTHSPQAAEKFITEVFWRIYFKGYLEQRPTIWQNYRNERDAALDRLAANPGRRAAYLEAIEGQTGINAFDQWVHELTQTGYLHNHARMWFASIWIFTLKLDWQLGADFFLQHLIDGDAASNTLSWRWVAGLHTKGKTYLARADNIARYTANHPQGPLEADNLTDEALPLEEFGEHDRKPLELPCGAIPDLSTEPFALLLHDETASHVALGLEEAPALVIGAARPETRSPGEIGGKARSFAFAAVENGMQAAVQQFGCISAQWLPTERLESLLAKVGIQRVVVPYLPEGWTRDSLGADVASLSEQGCVVEILPKLDRATWPHAKAGFFGVKKQIDRILGEIGISGGG